MRARYAAVLFLILLGITAGSWLRAQPGGAATLRVRVREAGGRTLLPCRLTIVDTEGRLAKVTARKEPWIAAREGVVYTGTGEAEINLAAGRYTLYVTRGLEYGLVTRPFVAGRDPVTVEAELAREVETDGYVSCDTHIHTLTHSGHGDATIEERMATIAGEGIELAIATDHNHHTDYRPTAEKTRTHTHFTPVIGNEVTTKVGHFNAFPILPGSKVPNYQLTEWEPLLAGIRATPGVKVVVLNHPSDNHSGFIPTDPKRFHPASGESHDNRPWSFDGIEVVTSAALQSDVMKPYRDWFALLNRGHRISGIGSSDSHDVDRFILGQGRTYIASSASRPDRIDVDQACDSILKGKVLASMGLLTEAWVDRKFGVGELAPGTSPDIAVRVRVQAPRWIQADRIDLYMNGSLAATRPVSPSASPVKADLTIKLRRPPHDVWVVAVASGPGVREPYWPTARPYQPDRGSWDPRVIGSTNPIRVDSDGDGKYSSPRDYARLAVDGMEGSPQKLMGLLAGSDEATAVQAASLCRQRKADMNSPAFRRAVDDAAPAIRHGFVAYRNLLPQ